MAEGQRVLPDRAEKYTVTFPVLSVFPKDGGEKTLLQAVKNSDASNSIPTKTTMRRFFI